MLKTVLFTIVYSLAGLSFGADFAIVDIDTLGQLPKKPSYIRKDLGVAVVEVSDQDRAQISKVMHSKGRCGGYELVSLPENFSLMAPFSPSQQKAMDALFQHMKPSTVALPMSHKQAKPLKFSQSIADAVAKVSANRLKDDVSWISAYPTRRHDTKNKNVHVEEMKRRLETISAGKDYVHIDLVDHQRTGQKTLRATLKGSDRPNEIVALGAHFDSINQGFFQTEAPGADDDASGSANILEIFRLLMEEDQPKRSVQFFWYAAEEVGLVGSAEIAKTYKAESKDVVSVLQLDMTLHPGSGQFTMSYISDFTSPWLNQHLLELNRLYVKVKMVEDKCGYACSDHASWHRQGFHAATPFESMSSQMNRNIHSVRDVIDSNSDFEHSATFAQLGLAYALSLGNSEDRGPAN